MDLKIVLEQTEVSPPRVRCVVGGEFYTLDTACSEQCRLCQRPFEPGFWPTFGWPSHKSIEHTMYDLGYTILDSDKSKIHFKCAKQIHFYTLKRMPTICDEQCDNCYLKSFTVKLDMDAESVITWLD